MKIQTAAKTRLPIADCRLPIGSRNGVRRPRPSIANRQSSIENGFTLVELLLVLVILGTLAAIVLPKFSGISERSRVTAAQTQISTFKTALNAYEVDMGTYPKSLAELIQQPANSGTDWHGPYLDSDTVPKDPWGRDYMYVCPGKHNPSGFDVSSAGPNGQFGDADDICNWTLRR